MRYYLMLLLGLLLAGCSAATPSEGEGQQVLSAKLRSEVSGAPFRIESFAKTNGQELNVDGVTGYRLFYRAVVNFPDGLHTEELGPGLMQVDRFWWLPVRPGTRITYTGHINFQRSENGWMASGIELTNRSIDSSQATAPSGSGSGSASAPTAAPAANAVASQVPGSERLLALTPMNKRVALLRAILQSGLTCRGGVMTGAYQQQYQTLSMWVALCADGRNYAVFIAPSDDLQVRNCAELARLNLPVCRRVPPLPHDPQTPPNAEPSLALIEAANANLAGE